MGMDAVAEGAFGLLLSQFEQPEIKAVLEELTRYVDESEDEDEDRWVSPDELPRIPEFNAKFTAAFATVGIDVPTGAVLVWTGSESDRPARTDTDPDDWVLGFGLFTKPWNYPPMADNFRKNADFHTWVWMG